MHGEGGCERVAKDAIAADVGVVKEVARDGDGLIGVQFGGHTREQRADMVCIVNHTEGTRGVAGKYYLGGLFKAGEAVDRRGEDAPAAKVEERAVGRGERRVARAGEAGAVAVEQDHMVEVTKSWADLAAEGRKSSWWPQVAGIPECGRAAQIARSHGAVRSVVTPPSAHEVHEP